MRLDRESLIPLFVSVGIHIFLIGFLILLGQGATTASSPIEIQVIKSDLGPIKPIDMRGKQGLSTKRAGTIASERRKPIFGVSMASVTIGEVGEGEAVLPVGDTLMKDPEKQPVPLDRLTEMPRIVHEIKAPYPHEAYQKGIEGKVLLDLLIGRDGRVLEASVIKRAGYGFDEAALKAIKDFVFSPARIGEEPVPIRITYTYTFIPD